MDSKQDAKIVDLIIRLVFLGLFVYSAIIMVAPLVSVVVWALILCIALYPTYDWLQNKLGGHKKLSATVLVTLGLALTLGPVASAVTATVELGSDLSERAATGDLKVPSPPAGLMEIPVVGPKIAEIWTLLENNLGGALAVHGSQIIEVTKTLFGKVLSIGLGLLAMALSVIIMGVLFSPGPALAIGAQRFANRVFAPSGGEFILLAGATVRSVTKGVIGVAAIQALCAWLLFAVFGISSAPTLALICLILSIIQVGPGLIIIPAIIYAWVTMTSGVALAFTVLAVPILIMDNFLRPILMSKGLDTPMLVILIGVLGGMMAYGLIGVFVGPVMLAVFYELFKLWIDAESEVVEALHVETK